MFLTDRNLEVATYVGDVPRPLLWKDISDLGKDAVASIEVRFIVGARALFGCVALARANDRVLETLQEMQPVLATHPSQIARRFPPVERLRLEEEIRHLSSDVTLVGGAYDEVESSPVAFRIAGRSCLWLLEEGQGAGPNDIVRTIRAIVREEFAQTRGR